MATRHPAVSEPSVRRRMQATRRRDTRQELALRRALFSRGLRYRVDFSIADLRCRPDIVFSAAKIAVFVDGCFWHSCPLHGSWPKSNAEWWRAKLEANVRRDRAADERLRAGGWTVLRFWEHEDSISAAGLIAKVLKEQ
jgi:DNA mismatch endonuclease (patch repair protein)